MDGTSIEKVYKSWLNKLNKTLTRIGVMSGARKQDEDNVTAYTFRHTTATLAAKAGVGKDTIMQLMGHTRVSTTERYIKKDTVKYKRMAMTAIESQISRPFAIRS